MKLPLLIIRIIALTLFLCLAPIYSSAVEQSQKAIFRGRVLDKESQEPIVAATITLPQLSLWAITDENGDFSIQNCPVGTTDLAINVLGYISFEQKYTVKEKATTAIFYLEQNNLRLREVEVSARIKKEGATPVTSISRSAIDHIQATSLADVLGLLPGAIPSNQSLGKASTYALRNITDKANKAHDMGSMGTSIIIDDTPISNNANLQAYAPATGALPKFQSVVGSGIDLRQVSTDNIESVDVIQGIASVQYGDASSGAVIVRSKAGKSPLHLRFKMNPNITQTSATTGHSLGGKNGNLNVSFDYAHSLNKENEAANTYNRYGTKFLYSNTFFEKLRANFSLDFHYAKDNMKQDQDDKDQARMNVSENKGFRFNANGSYQFNQDWLKSLQYTFSTSHTQQDASSQELVQNAEKIYSTAMTDNSVVGVLPNQHIYDVDGNQLTNWQVGDQAAYAYSTVNSYLGAYDISGREWNTFASLKAVFAKELGITSHRFIVGGDFKSDGNNGKGKTFDLNTPLGQINSSGKAIRERSYKDIPFLQTYGAYAEENFRLNAANRELDLQLGVRLDKQKDIKAEISPRINLSVEILEKMLYLRGGYGEIVKSAPLFYLYPENAYFDILNYTDKATNIANPQYLMTTRVFDTSNHNLRLAKNKKKEVGLDFILGRLSLNVTAYHEKMKNGYNFYNNYVPIAYNKYVNNGAGLVYDKDNSRDVYVRYNKPENSLYIENKGIDFNLNVARIDAIRTSFILSGAYIETKSYNNSESYFINNDNLNSQYVGIYEAGYQKYKQSRLATNLRVVHNIPELGFVVSLSAVTTWINKKQQLRTNDSIPVAYMSIADNLRYDFDPADADKSEFSPIVLKSYLNDNRFRTNSIPVLWSFNLNLTKEIGNNLSVSFFANNLFSYNPRYRKKRVDEYEILNPKSFFGIELAAKIPW